MPSLIPITKVDRLFIDYNGLKSVKKTLEKHPDITREELFKECIKLNNQLDELNNKVYRAAKIL